MERDKFLEELAGAANAALKIRNLGSSMIQERSGTSIPPDKILILGEIIKTVAEYSSDNHLNAIRNAVDISNLYRNTYKNLRQQIMLTRNKEADTTDILKALDIMKPMLPNHHKTVIEKIQKIYDIINS